MEESIKQILYNKYIEEYKDNSSIDKIKKQYKTFELKCLNNNRIIDPTSLKKMINDNCRIYLKSIFSNITMIKSNNNINLMLHNEIDNIKLILDKKYINNDLCNSKFYNNIINIIQDESLYDINTIEVLIKNKLIRYNEIFDKICEFGKGLYELNIEKNLIMGSKNYDINHYIFNKDFNQLFRKYLTDDLCNSNIKSIKTRSVEIWYDENGYKCIEYYNNFFYKIE